MVVSYIGISSLNCSCFPPRLCFAKRKQSAVSAAMSDDPIRSIGPSMFEGEALGLGAMYETRTIRVPRPFKVGPLPTGGSYIIMEFIDFGASRGNQSVLGRKLAEMHKAGKSEQGFGFDVDNTIGSTPQINSWTSDWIEFYGKHRLGYQLKLILDQYGDSTIYQKDIICKISTGRSTNSSSIQIEDR
ncbi:FRUCTOSAMINE 3 KINASE-RELATED PROTEIN [Salix purpurea]|uniref:protein-ribulosamine 3-kinase n=1 Tax=Salix purpurea TaxID=77065 RepID=A0A9Q0SQA7_SALPP|nr:FRUCTOSAMINE 3 KINASE-RELATED PROTEIN [Salix purpurea]